MLALAAVNRWRLAPRLGPDGDVGPVRRSLGMETLLGLAVLTAVSLLGTLPPPAPKSTGLGDPPQQSQQT